MNYLFFDCSKEVKIEPVMEILKDKAVGKSRMIKVNFGVIQGL